MPVELDRHPRDRSIVHFDLGDLAGKRGLDAQALAARLCQRDIRRLDDDACLAADRAYTPGEPDGSGGMGDLGKTIRISALEASGNDRRALEAADAGIAQTWSERVVGAADGNDAALLHHHHARGEPGHLV